MATKEVGEEHINSVDVTVEDKNDVLNVVVDDMQYADSDVDDKISELAQKYMQGIIHSGQSMSGYIDGKNALDEFLATFRILCSNTFPVRDSKRWCKPEERREISSNKSKLLWKLSSGVMPIPCFYTPFFVDGYLIRDCIKGEMSSKAKRNLQKRLAMLKESTSSTEPPKKQPRMSKKLGCPATIKIKEITIFPDFKIDPSCVKSAKGLRKLKEKQLNCLRSALQSPENVKSVKRFCIDIPLSAAHLHSTTTNTVLYTISFKAIQKIILERITELVRVGVTDITQIKHDLKTFLREEVFKKLGETELDMKRYYPSDKEIKTHIKSLVVNISNMNDKKKKLITELQQIASWACKCSDLNQLDTLLEKITTVKEDFSIAIESEIHENSNLLETSQDSISEATTTEQNDVCKLSKQTIASVLEHRQEPNINIAEQQNEQELHPMDFVAGNDDTAVDTIESESLNDVKSNATKKHPREITINDFIISNIEIGTNEGSDVNEIEGEVLYTIVESDGQVFVHKAQEYLQS